MSTIKGFHVCKAGNAPTVGQTKSFLIEGDRIRSKRAEDGGQNYTIVSVQPRESYKDKFDNLGFDIEVEAQNGSPTPAMGPRTSLPLSKDDYWRNKDQRDLEAIPRITRSHSQEMAIRTVAILMSNGLVSTVEEMKTKLKELTDYYQRDVSKSPDKGSEEVF